MSRANDENTQTFPEIIQGSAAGDHDPTHDLFRGSLGDHQRYSAHLGLKTINESLADVAFQYYRAGAIEDIGLNQQIGGPWPLSHRSDTSVRRI